MKKPIVVGMSGGVDSSMTLVTLKKQGWQPIGVSLKLPVWQNPKNVFRENICCTKESFRIARKICQKLNVPYYIFDVSLDFKKKVIDYFVSELAGGKTPNPCIICNRFLKFKKLFEFSQKVGALHVATGHYARVRKNQKTGQFELLMAKDKNKDQTYSLCFLPQKWLKSLVFPLGDYTKEQVYQMAKKLGFEFFLKRKQSQDFCFVAGKSLSSFLEEKIGKKEGKIVNTKDRVLGKHQGLHFYTIGQRKGLKIPAGPFYVKDFDFEKNLLIVAKTKQEISQRKLFLSPFHFISGETPKEKIKVLAKIRYRQPLSEAIIFPPKKGKLKVVFKNPQPAVTPGQFCVFYQRRVCLGGGKII